MGFDSLLPGQKIVSRGSCGLTARRTYAFCLSGSIGSSYSIVERAGTSAAPPFIEPSCTRAPCGANHTHAGFPQAGRRPEVQIAGIVLVRQRHKFAGPARQVGLVRAQRCRRNDPHAAAVGELEIRLLEGLRLGRRRGDGTRSGLNARYRFGVATGMAAATPRPALSLARGWAGSGLRGIRVGRSSAPRSARK
jgi:hypothetical protein